MRGMVGGAMFPRKRRASRGLYARSPTSLGMRSGRSERGVGHMAPSAVPVEGARLVRSGRSGRGVGQMAQPPVVQIPGQVPHLRGQPSPGEPTEPGHGDRRPGPLQLPTAPSYPQPLEVLPDLRRQDRRLRIQLLDLRVDREGTVIRSSDGSPPPMRRAPPCRAAVNGRWPWRASRRRRFLP